MILNYILIKQANINLLPGAKRRVEGRCSLFFLSVKCSDCNNAEIDALDQLCANPPAVTQIGNVSGYRLDITV